MTASAHPEPSTAPAAASVRQPSGPIHTLLLPCPLGGQMLLAATERGVCALTLGDASGLLLDALRHRFHSAALHPANARLTAWGAAVCTALGRATALPAVPLDLYGTPFQHQVWAALRGIPAGTVVSYATLAARMGAPRSIRASASACGANPVAVLVPCHRVIRSDGTLGGYRWGLARKQALLAQEGVLPASRQVPSTSLPTSRI
jgi:AraC family transcriptional regulator of adaptative response/methylated-DNA-[protein]-cysteine methyltransferase